MYFLAVPKVKINGLRVQYAGSRRFWWKSRIHLLITLDVLIYHVVNEIASTS